MEGKIHKCVFRIDKMKIQKKPYFTMLLIFLLIISTSILLYNGIGKSDTVEFTPFLYRELNESYLKNDWFVNVNDNTFNVRQNFIRLIKGILLIIPNIPLVYFLLYLATIFLVGISVYLISIHLFEKREIGILNMLLIFLGAPFSLGGNVLISDHLVSYGLSFAISLLFVYDSFISNIFIAIYCGFNSFWREGNSNFGLYKSTTPFSSLSMGINPLF